MNSQEEREKLMRFLATLPAEALDQLSQKQIDIFLLVHDIAAGHGLVLYEVGNICEGARRVLAGEDSPANLITFISEDKNIEEDNRRKIPEIAQEIQKQIFDAVLPILKKAGYPIKDGRVATPAIPISNTRPATPAVSEYGTQFGKGENNPPRQPPLVRGITTPNPSLERRGGEINIPSQFQVPSSKFPARLRMDEVQAGGQIPLDERHLRALLRIAAGTIYTEAKLREAFEDLPQGLRQAITSVDTANAVQDIAKKYLLHVDQMGSLASETGLVLLGLTHPKNFVANLAKRLRVPPERALEIGKEISARILSKVKDALRHLHEKGTGSPTEQPPARQNAPPPLIRGIQPPPLVGRAQLAVAKAAPFGKGDKTTPDPSLEKEGRIRTPYSPETKWNLGEDSRFKIQDSSPERLTREEVLRGIENPRSTYENTNYTNQRMDTNKTDGQRPSKLKTSNLPLETRVGPTGWRPPVNHETLSMKHEAERAKQETKEVEHFQTNSSDKIPNIPKPLTPPLIPPLAPTTPPRGLGTPPQAGVEDDGIDLVEQKLRGPVSAAPTEHRYAEDPYREQIE